MSAEHEHVPRLHAARSRMRRRLLRFLLLIVMILATALVLRFLFSFRNYMPSFYEPKDLEREQHQEKKK